MKISNIILLDYSNTAIINLKSDDSEYTIELSKSKLMELAFISSKSKVCSIKLNNEWTIINDNEKLVFMSPINEYSYHYLELYSYKLDKFELQLNRIFEKHNSHTSQFLEYKYALQDLIKSDPELKLVPNFDESEQHLDSIVTSIINYIKLLNSSKS